MHDYCMLVLKHVYEFSVQVYYRAVERIRSVLARFEVLACR
jgi:hypothetical protein